VTVCGRYRLRRHWEEHLDGFMHFVRERVDVEDPLYAGSDEARPTDPLPIIRRDDEGRPIAELRRWGFILMVDGKSIDPSTGRPKKVRRDVINAMSEKLQSNYLWKWSFKERRCLIPMSSWDEWPETGGGKQRVRVAMPAEPVFVAAGLYDANVDPKTGSPVGVFTMCTVPPNEFLGTVHDRAPMVLLPSQYDAWLDGGEAALGLVGTHPDVEAFEVAPV
jgi:putative SOS response-associated peptidase YedK